MQIGSWRIPLRPLLSIVAVAVLVVILVVVLSSRGGSSTPVKTATQATTVTTGTTQPKTTASSTRPKATTTPGGSNAGGRPIAEGKGLLLDKAGVLVCQKKHPKRCSPKLAIRTKVRITPVDNSGKTSGDALVVTTSSRGLLKVELAPGRYALSLAKMMNPSGMPIIVSVIKGEITRVSTILSSK